MIHHVAGIVATNRGNLIATLLSGAATAPAGNSKRAVQLSGVYSSSTVSGLLV